MRVFLNTVAASSHGVFTPDPQGRAVEIPDEYARELIKTGYAKPERPELYAGEVVHPTVMETAAISGPAKEKAVKVVTKNVNHGTGRLQPGKVSDSSTVPDASTDLESEESESNG